MIDDDAYLVRLQDIFDANDPTDGIDRWGGYGSDWRIVALRVVASDDGFDDLELDVHCEPPAESPAEQPLMVRARVLFDRRWRIDAGYEDPAFFALHAVREVDRALYGLVLAHRDGTQTPVRRPSVDGAREEESWAALLADLGDDDVAVREVEPGVLELEELDEPRTWVRVTREQWSAYIAEHGWDQATEDLAAVRSALWEEHFVFFRGRFRPSVRPELPPVTQEEHDRAEGLPADDTLRGGHWVAVDSQGREHRFPEMPEDD